MPRSKSSTTVHIADESRAPMVPIIFSLFISFIMTLPRVTGASGFIGSHVVDELLRQGYSVRGAVRSKNVSRISKSYESFGERFTTTVIEDLATSDLSEAIKGVDAIIHVASPLANAGSPEVILETAVSGTTRVLEAALAADVKKLVITASMASLISLNDFWRDIRINETVRGCVQPGATSLTVYSVSKALADRAAGDFKRDHPEFDITTIHPSYVFGPTGTGQVYNSVATGTNLYIYELIAGPAGRPVRGYNRNNGTPPLNVDVRDVARAHVLALKLPPSDTPKRFILSTSTFTWTEAIKYIAEVRPDLKARLPVITDNEPAIGPSVKLDTSATDNVLGLKNYVKWQDTVLDTINDLLRIEKQLAAQ
ncbi:NAD-P-binding protein [Multifurca ochricompacta]|uniref:NAD-P-binding protein n=1 Tax=Multifurca ochricompacta TaxID=376703 RepID=A0AAD4LTY7_9AGAM|nr:NAD-P-binding protein [Multifurca ochricompacta]